MCLAIVFFMFPILEVQGDSSIVFIEFGKFSTINFLRIFSLSRSVLSSCVFFLLRGGREENSYSFVSLSIVSTAMLSTSLIFSSVMSNLLLISSTVFFTSDILVFICKFNLGLFFSLHFPYLYSTFINMQSSYNF